MTSGSPIEDEKILEDFKNMLKQEVLVTIEEKIKEEFDKRLKTKRKSSKVMKILIKNLIRIEEELKAQREIQDKRFEAINARFEAIDDRFVSMNSRFESLQREMNARFEAMNTRFETLQNRNELSL
ncbi:MAG: hypothetical protein NZ853_10365 [Leptospiraceae bacterium]|nr:hypothetical protein [Leptospiraceae bacterium]